jgi:Flavodoxins
MKKISVIYASKTGHSKQLANAIAKEFKTEAHNFSSNPELDNTDLLFIVGGIYGGKSLPEFLQFIKNLDPAKIKKAALITSCTSGKTEQKEIRSLLEAKNIEVVKDEYICRGNFLLLGMGHPNEKEISDAVLFAKKLA